MLRENGQQKEGRETGIRLKSDGKQRAELRPMQLVRH